MASIQGLKAALINFSTTGDNVVVTAVAGTEIQIVKLFLVVTTTAVALTFKDGATALTGPMTVTAGIPFIIDESYAGIPWMTAAGNFVIGQGAGTSQVSGRVIYIQE
jgi:hypothetical protein